jgi:ABC-type multidrug transport system fused ATPase/permease subunit
MDKDTGKAFDFRLFKRVMAHTRPYLLTFYGVALAAILSTFFSVLTPYILRDIIDKGINLKDADTLLNLSIAMLR